MSKEAARQIISSMFVEFDGLELGRKELPNQPKQPFPPTGFYAVLDIAFVLHKITSIGSEPCTTRYGTISIEVSAKLDTGLKGITELTDALEDHFALKTRGNLWTSTGNTIYNGEDKSRTRYFATVHIPFTFEE